MYRIIKRGKKHIVQHRYFWLLSWNDISVYNKKADAERRKLDLEFPCDIQWGDY